MKDHVEIGHLTKYDAFRVKRDQVMDLKIWFKSRANVSNFETVSPKSSKSCGICKILSCTYYLKEAEMKIAMFAHLKEYHGKLQNG